MKLLIAEKPSLARTLGAALKIPVLSDGAELPKGADAVVISLVGHVMEACNPEEYDPIWKTWAFGNLPILPEVFKVAPIPSSKDKYRAAVKAIKDPAVTEVINACDPAREGELIFGLVFESTGSKKPTFRLWPKDLTDGSIRDAWKALKPWSDYQGLYDAAKCRQESDWILGMNATRAQTLSMQSKGGQGVYSIGRVQTPTLAILVNREKEIKNFKPKAFWTVVGQFGVEAGSYKGTWFTKGKDRFETEADAKSLAAKLVGKPAKIASVETHDARKGSEPLYNLSALQQECNRRFGMTADETLKVAQSLYEEKKVLSYPRTNSRHLAEAEEAKLPAILDALKRWPEFKDIVAEIESMGVKGKKLGKKFVDGSKVEDHSALIPTEVHATLNEREAKVFGLVVRRLLAAFFPDRVEAKTEIITVVEAETFKTNGTIVKEEGWSRIDPRSGAAKKAAGKGKKDEVEDDEGLESGEEDEGSLPRVKMGEVAMNKGIEPKRGETKPPRPITEGDLLKAMENAGSLVEDEDLAEAMKDNGLGTAATRASIIETLVNRGYILRKKKILQPTPKGIGLIDAIHIEALKSPSLTGDWEEKMNRMARGEYDRSHFMKEIKAFIVEVIAAFKGQAKDGGVAPAGGIAEGQVVGKCPKCKKGDLVLKSWRGEHYVQCADPGCKCAYSTDAAGKPLATCKFCKGPVKSGTSTKTSPPKPYAFCVACGESQDRAVAGGGSNGGSGGTAVAAKAAGKCPVCPTGTIEVRPYNAGFYGKCAACGVSYDTTETGKPKATCAFCKGPVKSGISTKSGSPKPYAICVKCKKFQDDPKGKPSAPSKAVVR